MKTKYIFCLFLTMIFTNYTCIQASWAHIVNHEEDPNQSYQQSVANQADQRLALLAENRAKHASIAQEAQAGKFPQGTNFEKVSAQKQEIIDQPAQNYFFNSWFRPANDSVSMTDNKQAIQLFQQNKPLIKENYRQANKLADAQTIQNTLQDATEIKFNSNPLTLIQTVPKVLSLGSNKESQTQVGQAYYKNIKNSKTNQYEVKRSGTSNQDTFVPETSQETVQQYADRYTAANNIIKPTDPAALTAQLKQENTMLANTIIPNAQSIGLKHVYNLGKSTFDNYNAMQDLGTNIKNLPGQLNDAYTKYTQPNNTTSAAANN